MCGLNVVSSSVIKGPGKVFARQLTDIYHVSVYYPVEIDPLSYMDPYCALLVRIWQICLIKFGKSFTFHG